MKLPDNRPLPPSARILSPIEMNHIHLPMSDTPPSPTADTATQQTPADIPDTPVTLSDTQP